MIRPIWLAETLERVWSRPQAEQFPDKTAWIRLRQYRSNRKEVCWERYTCSPDKGIQWVEFVFWGEGTEESFRFKERKNCNRRWEVSIINQCWLKCGLIEHYLFWLWEVVQRILMAWGTIQFPELMVVVGVGWGEALLILEPKITAIYNSDKGP